MCCVSVYVYMNHTRNTYSGSRARLPAKGQRMDMKMEDQMVSAKAATM